MPDRVRPAAQQFTHLDIQRPQLLSRVRHEGRFVLMFDTFRDHNITRKLGGQRTEQLHIGLADFQAVAIDIQCLSGQLVASSMRCLGTRKVMRERCDKCSNSLLASSGRIQPLPDSAP